MCLANRGATSREIAMAFGVESDARLAISQLLCKHGFYCRLVRKGDRRDYVLLLKGQEYKLPPRPKKPIEETKTEKRRKECRKRIDKKFKTLKKLSQERWLNIKDITELLALPFDNAWKRALCHSLRKAGFGMRRRGVLYKEHDSVWIYGYKKGN